MLRTFRVGEDIELEFDAYHGDVNAAVSVAVKMSRAYRIGGQLLGSPLDMVVVNRAAAGLFPAGWTASYSATLSAALQPGTYAFDLRITFADITQNIEKTGYFSLIRSVFG